MIGRNEGGRHRCSICNAVNSEDIESVAGDYREGLQFTHDPDNPLFDICIECAEEIESVKQDYEFDEGEDGW